MIKISKLNNPPVKAALYYVRIKTYNDNCLFEVSADLTSADLTSADLTSVNLTSVNLEVPTRDASLKPSAAASIAQIAVDELLLAAEQRGITLEQWVILPDALHALIALQDHGHDPLGAKLRDGKALQGNRTTGKPRALNTFVARFKAATAKRINLQRNQPGSLVWQRSYSEQRIEDERMLSRLQHNIRSLDKVVMRSQ